MIFIIGGSYQGKVDFALEKFGLSDSDVFLCTAETREIDLTKRCIAHIEQFALGCVQRGEEPRLWWEAHAKALSNHILIADDVSCGVVPIDPILRTWREATGRANNWLAGQADEAWRVFCGLGVQIK